MSSRQHSTARASSQRSSELPKEREAAKQSKSPGRRAGRMKEQAAARKSREQQQQQHGRAGSSKTIVRQIKGKKRRTCDRTQGKSNAHGSKDRQTQGRREG